MINLPINVTTTNKFSTYDTQGAMIYILGIFIWYTIGFSLILINNIIRRKDHFKEYIHSNIYQSIHNLHKQQIQNNILIEFKDKDKRKKLWEIYYDTKKQKKIKINKSLIQ
ncbi:unnamed protein product [Rotaria sordida]|uniref:Uncharacterized protein n=1 Tax=Rotaria sordida TaxID=392033 RepID=A0A814Z495_9BILA|nr:unnamed protein product [Rotaria sordida]CAF3785729.1 unnamed protein product [Rotaria sordida]